LRVRWRYLPHLAPWLLRFLHSSTPARYTTSATALAALLARAYSGYEDLIAKSGLETFIQRQACLYLYSSANAFEAAAPSLKLRNRLGVATETLDRAAIHQLEPHLNPLFEKGVLFPDSWFLSNPAQFLTQLKDHLVNAGMVLHTQAVQSIAPRADGVSLQTEAGSAGFDYVAVCAGAHAGTFAQQCGDALPLRAERGYHITYPGTTGLISRPVGWAERGFYMTPMASGIRVAGTVELAGLNRDKHQGLLDLLQYSSQRALPGLGTATQPWLGFRPTLPDGLPVLGHSRASARVVYAFGHQHIGLTLGGLSGTIVADLVAGRSSPLDLRPYAASRF
jgi:D-amino-acid dehydrogenase